MTRLAYAIAAGARWLNGDPRRVGMSDKSKTSGAHDSGQTSDPKTSREGGRHRADVEESTVEGRPLGSRTQRPHHPDGWEASR